MIIAQTRINSLERHLLSIPKEKKIKIGISDISRFTEKLNKIGFTDFNIGNKILPARVGPVSNYNANGRNIPNKNLPKEKVEIEIYWEWEEWHGKDKILQGDIKTRTYERYPRIFLPPPSIEFVIGEKDDTKIVFADQDFMASVDNYSLKHAINLFLEIFGECEIFDENTKSIAMPKFKRLNWEILPPGKHPFEKINESLKTAINKLGKNKQILFRNKLQFITKFGPDFAARGNAGFNGYVVLGFKSKDIYIVESMFYGNATYIFNKNWEILSQMTKAEILSNELQQDRLIHTKNWDVNIAKVINGENQPLKS